MSIDLHAELEDAINELVTAVEATAHGWDA